MATTEQADRILKILENKPHQGFGAQKLAKLINPAAARKPDQLPQLMTEITNDLEKLVEEEKAREIEDGFFKARVYTNETREIEHAFLGGMGDTAFRFKGPVFRLNIGVISAFFIRDPGQENWVVLVRDTTAGTMHCLLKRLQDGTYQIGGGDRNEDANFLSIPGRYIEEYHTDLTIQGESIQIADQRTPRGTRIDFLIPEGLQKYRKAAQDYLKGTDASEKWEPVSRGKYVLDRVRDHHEDFEVTFFSAVTDLLLYEEGIG